MIEEVTTKTPNLPFAVHTVLSCKKERGGELFNIYDLIEIDKIQDLVAERLKKHFVDGNKDIFSELKEERDWAFVLYQWATNWMTFKGGNNQIVNNYVLSLIKDNSKKFAKFIMHQLQRTEFSMENLRKIYNIEKLKDLAEKHKDSDMLNQEEIEAIKKVY